MPASFDRSHCPYSRGGRIRQNRVLLPVSDHRRRHRARARLTRTPPRASTACWLPLRHFPASASGAFRGAPRSAACNRSPLSCSWHGRPARAAHPWPRSRTRRACFRAPRQGGGDRLLAREESEEVRPRDTGALGGRLGRGAVAVERELAIAARGWRCRVSLPAHPARAALSAGAGQLNLKPAGDAARDQFRA